MSAPASKPAFRLAGRSRCAALVGAALALACGRAAARDLFVSAEHRIAGLAGSIAPELHGSTALFAHRPSHPTRYVALRFRDDPALHVYGRETRRSGAGPMAEAFTLFILTIDLAEIDMPAGGRLLYRMSVDGTWMTDPANPLLWVDPATQLPWSVMEVNPGELTRLESPQWIEGGLVRFRFAGEPGRRVALAGDFNRWDPYMHTLAEVSPGLYSIDVRLPAGPRLYMFVVDGVWTPDPANPRRGLDAWGRTVCVASREPVAASGRRGASGR